MSGDGTSEQPPPTPSKRHQTAHGMSWPEVVTFALLGFVLFFAVAGLAVVVLAALGAPSL